MSNTNQLNTLNQEVLERVNGIRVKKRLAKLEIDSCLCNAAWNQTNYLLDKKKLSHSQSTKKTKSPTDRLNYYGCEFHFNAENIIRVYSDSSTTTPAEDAKKMIKLWMNSNGHRANILHEKARKTCITSKTKNNRILTVQVLTD